MKKIRLLIVDDHTLVRDGLISMLRVENDINIVGEASNGKDALQIIKNAEVDVVLTDIVMDELNGLETTKLIKEYNENIEVILLSMEVNEGFISEGIKNGAKSYLPKDVSKRRLLEAIRSVSKGEKYFCEKISKIIFESFYHKSKGEKAKSQMNKNLSSREKEILILLSEGNSSQEISDELNISVKTVDTHRYNIMQKLKLKNIAELIRYAIKNNLVSI